MRVLRPHAKLTIRLDAEGWLEIWDGYQTVGLPPDDVALLSGFLAAGPVERDSAEPEQENIIKPSREIPG